MDLKDAQSEIYRLLAERKQMICDTIKDNKENIEDVRDVLSIIGDASTVLKIIQPPPIPYQISCICGNIAVLQDR